jgi:hypothetical protein
MGRSKKKRKVQNTTNLKPNSKRNVLSKTDRKVSPGESKTGSKTGSGSKTGGVKGGAACVSIDSDSDDSVDIPLSVDRINGIEDQYIIKARQAAAQLAARTSRHRPVMQRTPRKMQVNLKPIERIDVAKVARDAEEAAKKAEEEEFMMLEREGDDDDDNQGMHVCLFVVCVCACVCVYVCMYVCMCE